MNDAMDIESILKNECIETLMLICSISESPYRQQALQELHRRRLIDCPEQFSDSFMTNLSVVA